MVGVYRQNLALNRSLQLFSPKLPNAALSSEEKIKWEQESTKPIGKFAKVAYYFFLLSIILPEVLQSNNLPAHVMLLHQRKVRSYDDNTSFSSDNGDADTPTTFFLHIIITTQATIIKANALKNSTEF